MTTILLVSPDVDVRTIFRTVLEHAGYAVVSLDCMERLMEYAATCHLVITDYPTPASDGCTVTRRLRSDTTTKGVPILNATTHVMPSEIAAATAAGVTETLVLPADLASVLARVRAIVGGP